MSRLMGSRPFEEYIAKKGYTSVAKFGEACGIPPQQIFNHIRGIFNPSVDAMFKYAKTLGVEFDEIVKIWYLDDFKELEEVLAGGKNE